MDVKETLTRWSRAYKEPSLFYVPVKKDELRYATVTIYFTEYFISNNIEMEHTITNNYRTSSIVGAIFSVDGTFIERVTIPSNSCCYVMNTKLKIEDTYIFKEAISPKGCLLAENTVFRINNIHSYDNNIFYGSTHIKHKMNGFKVLPTLEESVDHNTDIKRNIETNSTVVKEEHTIEKRYNIYYNFYSLYDNSLIRKIEDAFFVGALCFNTSHTYNGLGYYFPCMGEGNNIYWLYTQNSTDDLNAFGKFEYIQSSGYDKYYRCLVELFFKHSSDSPRLSNVYWGASADDSLSCQYKFLQSLVRIEDCATGLYRDDTVLNNSDSLKFVTSLTEEKMMNIYQFALENVSPQIINNYNKTGYVLYRRVVWIGEDGTYSNNGADVNYYHSISVDIVGGTPKYANTKHIPNKIMFSDSKTISNDDLFAITDWIDGSSLTYQRYFLTDYKEDTSIYFHGIDGISSYEEIKNNPLIEVNSNTFQVFTQEFVDEKLLTEINLNKKDGE